MPLCCGGKKSCDVAESFVSPGPPPSPRKSTSLEKIRQSFMTPEAPEETEWKVGGRYKVQRSTPVWSTAQLCGSQVGELKLKDTVMVLAVQMHVSTEVGLVVPSAPDSPGWIVLQDAMDERGCPLVRRRLEGSWDMKARYCVKNPATVRKEASLSSEVLGEVEPGDEVLVLDLDLDTGSDGRARLRALVSTEESRLIGWLSPETAGGDRLLDPVNLLGPEVVEIHRKSLMGGGSPSRDNAGARKSVGSPGPRRSCHPGSTVPWEVGGKYRVLEKLVIRERPELTSREIGKVSPCSIVTITDIHHAECAHLNWCPCAFVTVDEGAEEGSKGWVRCAAKDGHDLIDTRDQTEFDRIVTKIRQSQVHPPQQQGQDPPQEGDEETSETASEGARERSRSASSSSTEEGQQSEERGAAEASKFPKVPGALKGVDEKFAEKLDALEEHMEDRLIVDNSAMEEKSYMCGCSCGAKRN